MKVDDSVRIIGGKSKGFEGVITSLNNVFIMVRFTKDKKQTPLFAEVSKKVKRIYLEVIEPPPIEMPKDTDLKHVDNLEEPTQNIFDTIDEHIASHSTFLPQNQDKVIKDVIEEVKEEVKEEPAEQVASLLKPPYMVNENNVKEPAMTMDDAINYRDDNVKLTYKMDAMMMFQNKACQEIGDLKFEIKQLKEQLDDSVCLDKIEELKKIINSI
jgi:gas vesicle protein